MIDTNGRVIVPKGMTGVKDANTNFYYTQPKIDIPAIYHRLRKHFGPEAKLPTLEDFGARYAALQAEVSGNHQVVNLFKGVWFPICIPETPEGDYGTILETIYLSAVESAYKEAFPGRTFENWRKGELVGKVTVNHDTRHEFLVEHLKHGPVTGLYFTRPLQGFGIQADRDMIGNLPEGFSLSGGFDAAAAFVADAKTMAQGFNTTVTNCAALSWREPFDSLCFGPNVGSLVFGNGDLDPHDFCSAGLFFFR